MAAIDPDMETVEAFARIAEAKEKRRKAVKLFLFLVITIPLFNAAAIIISDRYSLGFLGGSGLSLIAIVVAWVLSASIAGVLPEQL